jgi:transcriptional regulator with XRE-family HTH domain
VARGRHGAGIAVDPERVRAARLEAGLTLSAVAGDEVSRTFIHQVERGVSRPSIDVLKLIAKRTAKPMNYFVPVGREARIAGAELSTELAIAAELVKSVAASVRLSRADRQKLAAVGYSLRRAMAIAASLGVGPPS